MNAILWARSVVADPAIVYLDTETSGLGPDAEIVDLAILGQDGDVLLDTLVRPIRPIPPEATAVHGITDADVATSSPWSALYGAVRMVLQDKVVCGFNASYDVGVIHAVTAVAGLDPLDLPYQCAMKAHAEFAGVPGNYRGSYRWHKLGEACALLGVPPTGYHRAKADAEACRQVVRAMAQTELPSSFDLLGPRDAYLRADPPR